MKLSSHEEYGLRCLLQVARQGIDGSATIPEISRKEGISEPYAAKLLRVLRQGGFVKAVRGKAGGYRLALPPEGIHIAEALAVLGGRIYEEDFCLRHSGTQRNCVHSTNCSMRSLWRSVQAAIDGVLGTMTINDLLTAGPSAAVTSNLNSEFIYLNSRSKQSYRGLIPE
jgi:Rrf2 family protein